jgi:hypothetical protein
VFYNFGMIPGVGRGWQTYVLPAWGQISNVAALVLPMAEDERHDAQLPMWSAEEVEDLRQTARDLLAAARLQERIQARMLEQQQQRWQQPFDFIDLRELPTRPPAPRPPTRRKHPVQNPRHRTWSGFVQAMQELEGIARREGLRLSKRAVCQFGPDSPKTITRTMARYGLRPEDWPPSTWNPDRPLTG